MQLLASNGRDDARGDSVQCEQEQLQHPRQLRLISDATTSHPARTWACVARSILAHLLFQIWGGGWKSSGLLSGLLAEGGGEKTTSLAGFKPGALFA